jgi:hypothetical protein
MATRKKPSAPVEFPNPDAAVEQIVITGTITMVDRSDVIVGPEPEKMEPPPGFITSAPDIAVFNVVDDSDNERRLAIAEWKRVTPRTERLRHPFEG